MGIPNYNNPNQNQLLHHCKICGQIKVAISSTDQWNELSGYPLPDTCDDCKNELAKKEMEKSDVVTGDGSQLLLDKYYKRNIKISYTYNKQKCELYFYAVMIPNKDNWLDDKIKECKKEMEKAGLKKISFKMADEFWQMANHEISECMNDQKTRIFYGNNQNEFVQLPIILISWRSPRINPIKSHNITKWRIILGLCFLASIIILLMSMTLFVLAIVGGHYFISLLFILFFFLSLNATINSYQSFREEFEY